jgi:hypothetical protein
MKTGSTGKYEFDSDRGPKSSSDVILMKPLTSLNLNKLEVVVGNLLLHMT